MYTRSSGLDFLQALAIVLVALCLVPAGAHFFELFNKLTLAPQAYMTVQSIYAGWALFGIAIFSALAVLLVHAFLVRHNRAALALSLLAFFLIVLTQVIFWTYTYPMNALTQNWTVSPANLETARDQWEYSHAVNALITFLAFLVTIAAVFATRPAISYGGAQQSA